MKFIIDEKHDGVLLRSYLKGTCRVSTRFLTRLKAREDGILVNGERVTVRYRLAAGDILEIAESDELPQDFFNPERLDFRILYEDADILLVSKPPYMPTHPSNGHNGDTLANALAWHYREIGEAFVFRPVSRLDRNTSGIVTIAKNQYAASILCKAMKEHQFQKTYYAVTEGIPQNPDGVIEGFLHRRTPGIVIREICGQNAEGAEYAKTVYRVLDRTDTHALLELEPLTGRTHQIRVHLASIGCPIVGDGLYGKDSELIGRQALHAARLQLTHPITGHTMQIEDPAPDDFMNLLAETGLAFPEK